MHAHVAHHIHLIPSLLASSCSSSDNHAATKAYTYKQGDPPLLSPLFPPPPPPFPPLKEADTHGSPLLHLPGINVITVLSPLYSSNEGHVLIKLREWMGLLSLLSKPISLFLPSAIRFFFDLLPCSPSVIRVGLPPHLGVPIFKCLCFEYGAGRFKNSSAGGHAMFLCLYVIPLAEITVFFIDRWVMT